MNSINSVIPVSKSTGAKLYEPQTPGAWRHPQAWVPAELSFYLFLVPFFFWPVVTVLMILQIYSQDLDGVPLSGLKTYEAPTVSFILAADGTPMAEIYSEHRLV
ncbi:MAG: hypothetical protein LBF22_01830, partial [Deltaproteobacteria bacterium]|nr:hypothetical protein [Deltaproteobacteria bacterium]